MNLEYSDSKRVKENKWVQEIILNGKSIGYLVTTQKNWLSDIEETYMIPDVDYGLQDGWIDFKCFKDYNGAVEYAQKNFEKVVYLFKNGDFD